jgi:hypothetical protein
MVNHCYQAKNRNTCHKSVISLDPRALLPNIQQHIWHIPSHIMKIPHTIFKLTTKPHLKLYIGVWFGTPQSVPTISHVPFLANINSRSSNTSQSPNLPPPGFPPHLNPSNPSIRIDTSSNHHSSSQPPNMGSTISSLGPDVSSNQSDGLHAYEDTIPALPPPILFPS